MPVIDHPIHESTRQAADARYGCWNLERSPGYWAQDGWDHTGPDGMGGSTPRWVWVSDVMTPTCRYDKSTTDGDKCAECYKRGQGEVYDQMVRRQGT